MFKDKLFFFGAQEWVNFFEVSTNTATVPTLAMRQGDFSELLGSNPFFSSPDHPRSADRAAVPRKHHSVGTPVSERHRDHEAVSRADAGFQQGTANAIFNSENPQDQRKDSIRLDYRLNNNNQFMFRFQRSNWVAIDAFRGTFPFARTEWERPNRTETFNWTSTIKSNLINDFNYSHSLDEVFISVFTETGLHSRTRGGVNYPYIFPVNKEIEDKIPTVNVQNFSGLDGGPYPASSAGPIHTFSNTSTLVKGRHTLQGRRCVRVLRRGRLRSDQRQRHPGRHQQPERPVRVQEQRDGGSGLAMADMALGLFTPTRSLAACVHEVAVARDRLLHSGLVEATSN